MPGASARTPVYDTDGQMPFWLAQGIVQAMVDTYTRDASGAVLPQTEWPANLQGSAFQRTLDPTRVASLVQQYTGAPTERR